MGRDVSGSGNWVTYKHISALRVGVAMWKMSAPTNGQLDGKIRKFQRKALRDHLDNKCIERRYKCEYCGHEDTYRSITGKGYHVHSIAYSCHYDTCPEYPLKCPNKCGAKDIKRKDMSAHRYKCPEEVFECPNKCVRTCKDLRLGFFLVSEVMTLKQKDLQDHLSNKCYLRQYQCEHCGLVDTYEKITGSTNAPSFRKQPHYNTCPEFPLECPNKCGATAIKRKHMSAHRDECPLERVKCSFEMEGCTTRVVRKDFDNHMSTQMLHHLLLVKMKHDKDMKEMKTKHEGDMKEVKTKHEGDLTRMMKAISMNVDSLLQTCTEDQKLPLQSIRAIVNKSYHLKKNGDSLTIEIPNLFWYMTRRKVWHSPPFYIKEGYKMCFAIRPNGTGEGTGTHISISLILMKGEFDDQLEWPINQPARFMVASNQPLLYTKRFMLDLRGLVRVCDDTVMQSNDCFIKHGTRAEQEMVRGTLAEVFLDDIGITINVLV